jgi:glycosyltransferase involved in cell wall biosynthesis
VGAVSRVAVVIPAKDEAQRIAATASAAGGLPDVDLVVVVDDGSTDATAQLATAAGATVVRHAVPRGKAGAMETGAELVRVLESRDGRDAPRVLLFLDADLEGTARAAAPLVPPVLAGEADMTIAVLPPQRTAGGGQVGGRGLVVRLARDGIRAATGWEATQPLSGQRCLTREAFAAALPLAGGFGVETGLTVDLLRRGLRVREVECDLHHRATGTDLRAQLHRARQWRDVARALAARRVLPRRARP